MRVDKAVSELYRASSEFTEAASESPEAWAVFCFWLIVEGLRGAACPYSPFQPSVLCACSGCL